MPKWVVCIMEVYVYNLKSNFFILQNFIII